MRMTEIEQRWYEDICDNDGLVSIKDLADHFIERSEYFKTKKWTLQQILANLAIICMAKEGK